MTTHPRAFISSGDRRTGKRYDVQTRRPAVLPRYPITRFKDFYRSSMELHGALIRCFLKVPTVPKIEMEFIVLNLAWSGKIDIDAQSGA
ncbi:MAG: hypothetical protein HGB22_10640 [Chlorobiaceae bacterium]|nr:hypothetical protein [Chlorobiaceae bacterium]